MCSSRETVSPTLGTALLPVVRCAELRPLGIPPVHFNMSIAIVLVQLMLRQSYW